MDHVTDADLEQDFGIKVRLHRVKIIEGIKKLQSGGSSDNPVFADQLLGEPAPDQEANTRVKPALRPQEQVAAAHVAQTTSQGWQTSSMQG